ncbi:hypothetical protein ACTQ49_06900 [Luteococcus sp. Sow4_B9]|uniref:hypothetical protein n=1 Tax=Luteococcus sp. Sow4_B9 TaxID=3438792 RepID=UPI003F9A601A
MHRPPDGMARGSVVLVPAVDRESVVSYRAWHVLARQLARAGFVVVRIALRGDGDSSDLADGDVVEQWLEDIRAAVGLARRILPEVPVSLVGLRIGASLVAACDLPEVDYRLAWEPVSGKDFLDRQHALRTERGADPVLAENDGFETLGEFYTPAQAASIARLAAPAADDPIVRREVDCEEALELHAASSVVARIPVACIAEVVASVPTHPVRPLVDWEPTTVGQSMVAGIPVRERFVEVGPARVHGVVTEPLLSPAGAVALFCSGGGEPKDGPSALWARTARTLAADGVVSVRCDRRGVGEELDEDAVRPPNPYDDRGIQDMVEATTWARGYWSLPIIGIGLSAGCWTLARACESAPLDGLLMFSSVGWHKESTRYANLFRPNPLRQLLRGGGAVGAVPLVGENPSEPTMEPTTGSDVGAARGLLRRVAHQLVAARAAAQAAARFLACHLQDLVRRNLPDPIWQALGRRGVVMDPTELLACIPVGTPLSIYLSPDDHRLWERCRGPQAAARRMADGAFIRVIAQDFEDHALFSQRGRRAVVQQIRGEMAPVVRTVVPYPGIRPASGPDRGRCALPGESQRIIAWPGARRDRAAGACSGVEE